MGKSTYLENLVLDWITGQTAMPALPTPWLALFTVAPSDAGGGTEVSGGSYARVNVASAFTSAASGGSVSNTGLITFPTATANWGTIVAVALFNASTAGNMLTWASLPVDSRRTITTGQAPTVPIGDLTLTED